MKRRLRVCVRVERVCHRVLKMQDFDVFDLYLKAQFDLDQNLRICSMHVITTAC